MINKTSQIRVLFGHCHKLVGLLVLGVFLFVAILTGVKAAFEPNIAQAATNTQLNFQARLQTSSGAIVPDGFYNVEFKLYSASSGGTFLWNEEHYDSNGVTAGNDNRIRVKNGYLTVSLGSQNAFPTTINWDQELWITMNIGGTTQTATPTYDGEMNPRLKLTGVPYAFRAGQLAKFNSGTGFTSTLELVAPTGGNQTFSVPDQGAAGNYTLLTTQAANSGYIQNTNTPQTANFNITGNGVIGGNMTVGGNINLSGNMTVNNFNSISATNAANTVINKNTSALAQSPIPSTLWHDLFAFNKKDTPDHEAFNGTWNAATLNSGLFAQIENQSITVADGTTNTAARWTWNSGSYSYSQGEWLNIGFTYDAVASNKTVLFESSPDGTTWTTRHASTGNMQNAEPAWFKVSDNSAHPYLRLTITSTNSAPIKLSSIRLLSGRWGDQGSGSELSYPYSWDASQRLAIGQNAVVANGVLTIGTNTTSGTGGLYLGTDTNLYRSAANTLQTDDSFTATGTIRSNTGFNANGSAGATTTCTGGQLLQNAEVAGGIVTGGSCVAPVTGGVTVVGTIDSQTKNANGAVISGTNIYMQTADATNPGLVSTGTQTFAGSKTFTGNATLIKPGTNSTTAFQIQPASSSTSVLNVDTTNSRVGIGTNAPGAALHVVGQIRTSGSAGELQLYSNDNSGNFYTLYSATGELSFYGGLNIRAVLTAGGNFGVGLNANPQYPLDITGDINTSTRYRVGGTVGLSSLTCTGGQLLQNATILGGIATAGSCVAPSGGSGVTTVGTIDSQTKSANGAVISGTNIYMQTADATNPGLVSTGTQTFAGSKTFTGNATLIKPGTNSTTAFQIQPSGSTTPVLNVDTSNSRIGIGTATPNAALEVNGEIWSNTTNGFLSLSTAAGVNYIQSGTSGGAGSQHLYISGPSSAVLPYMTINATTTEITGAVTVGGNTTLGNASADRLTLTAQLLGASPIVMQGATDNSFTTTLALTDPTANRTITLPNASGTVAVSATGNVALSAAGQISLTGTIGVGNGGTGTTSYTTNGVLYYNGTNFASTAAGTSGDCLKSNGAGSAPTYGACGTGSASTLQDAYTASGSTNPQIQLSAANGGLKIRDSGTPVSGNLFQLQNSGGTVTYFGASTAGITIQNASAANALVFTSSDGHLKIYNPSNAAKFVDIYYDNAADEAVFTAAGGGTTRVGSGSGNISLSLSNAADILTATKTLTLGGAYSANDFNFTRAITAGATSLTGSVVNIESLSSGSANASTILRVNENNNSATGNLIVATKGGAGNDKFKVDTGGTVTIAAGQSYTSAGAVTYTGGGAVTVSSAASTALTLTGNAASTFSTTAGALTLTGAAGVNITGGTGNVTIGTSDTTGTLLVLDTKTNAGDPTGVDGAMYYNSNLSKFRCYEGGVWRNCIFPEAIVTKSADQNANASSTTFQNVSDLVVPLDASSRYTFQATIPVNVSNITADARITFTVPAGATITASGVTPLTATTNTICNIVTSGQVCSIAVGTAFRSSVTINGLVTTGGTAGDLQFQFAQNTSTAASAPTVMQGGMIRYIKQ